MASGPTGVVVTTANAIKYWNSESGTVIVRLMRLTGRVKRDLQQQQQQESKQTCVSLLTWYNHEARGAWCATFSTQSHGSTAASVHLHIAKRHHNVVGKRELQQQHSRSGQLHPGTIQVPKTGFI
jgi:hypothetical protein